jgi:hypothetical protein
LPRWLQRLVRALRRRAPAGLTIADALSPRGLRLVSGHGGGLPLVIVNGVRVLAWAEESVYEVVLARGEGPPRFW